MRSKQIKLSKGHITFVDAGRFNEVIQFKWYVMQSTNTFYAYRRVKLPCGRMTSQFLHQFLFPDFDMHDHKDGNGLNNTGKNIRAATHSQNSANRRKQSKPSSSRFKGVAWNKKRGLWVASIAINKKSLYLGYYESEEDAAHVYDYAARIYFGEFARPNFPDSGAGHLHKSKPFQLQDALAEVLKSRANF